MKKTNDLLKIPQERYCKICFKRISRDSFYHLLHRNSCICYSCLRRMLPRYKSFKICGISGFALYEYDEEFKNFMYQLKGCRDVELGEIFIERYKYELAFLYKNYVIVPAPSYHEDDLSRGFNHVIEIFKYLGNHIENALVKTKKVKQAELKAKDRGDIKKYIELRSEYDFKNKRVLIVDDILTTGSTIEAIVNIIKPLKPKKIKILVICKTVLKPMEVRK